MLRSLEEIEAMSNLLDRLSSVSDVDYAANLASGSLSLLRLQVLGICSIWAVDHEVDPVVQYFVRGAV